MIDRVTVQTLIGKNHLSFYIKCLKSLVRRCYDPINLHIHSDGTLNEFEKESLMESFNETPTTIVDAQFNQEVILDSLVGYPNCQKFRKESIWAVEFFDPLFANLTDPYSFYIDADILFIKSFKNLFLKSNVAGGAIFLKDTQWNSYCLRPWQLKSHRRRSNLVEGITTAIVCWDKNMIDWDYLEWFLGSIYLHKIPQWVLPTAQAGLASRCKAKTLCPKQLPNLYPNTKLTDEMLGVHLLGTYRKKWLEKIDNPNINLSDSDEKITNLKFINCKNLRTSNYVLNQARRWFNTRLGIW